MSKIKIYESEEVLDDLITCLSRNIQGGENMLHSFKVLLICASPIVKSTAIRDMWKFINTWREIVNATVGKVSNKTVLSHILTKGFIFGNEQDFFRDTYDAMIAEGDADKDKDAMYRYTASYISCIVKAVIQTTRRKSGFDNNPKMRLYKRVNPDTIKTGRNE